MKKTLVSLNKISVPFLFPFLLLGCTGVTGSWWHRAPDVNESGQDTNSQATNKRSDVAFTSYEFLNAIQQDLSVSQDTATYGSAEAQLQMGRLFANARYYSDAIEWYKKSAEQGNAEAQYELANAYKSGKGVMLRNPETAMYWYQKAAAQGHVGAEYALRSMMPASYPSSSSSRYAQSPSATTSQNTPPVDAGYDQMLQESSSASYAPPAVRTNSTVASTASKTPPSSDYHSAYKPIDSAQDIIAQSKQTNNGVQSVAAVSVTDSMVSPEITQPAQPTERGSSSWLTKKPEATTPTETATVDKSQVVTRVGPTYTWDGDSVTGQNAQQNVTQQIARSVAASSVATANPEATAPASSKPVNLALAPTKAEPPPLEQVVANSGTYENKIVLPGDNESATASKSPVKKPSSFTPPDLDKPINLASVQSAAEDGDSEAQLLISLLYSEGKQVPQDQDLSVMWGRKAAEQGNAIAQNNLGAAYTHGKGVSKDDSLAAYWYQKSAEQGYTIAQYNLAASYAMGVGVQKDYQKAYAWFSVLLAQKGENVMDDRADTVIAKLEAMLSKNGQLDMAKKLAAEYVKKYAKS